MNKTRLKKRKMFLSNRAKKIERVVRKRKIKKLFRNIIKKETYGRNKIYREKAKYVKSYSDVLALFMPKNLAYLFSYNKSPICLDKIQRSKCKPWCIVRVPKLFSILSNPKESYESIGKIVKALICQEGQEVWIDYNNCQDSDLLTQLFLDAILKDWDEFGKFCIRANLHHKYLRVRSIGGRNYHNLAIQKMLNSVGSPTILLKRRFDYQQIIPFNLRYFDKEDETVKRLGASNELDTTLLIEYVNDCLNKVGKKLTDDAAAALGTVIAEPVINASEHSTLKSRYLIGYFENQSEAFEEEVHGILNLVIMNFGKSIYEKFKYPDDGEIINSLCVQQMKDLSDFYNKNKIFQINKFQESTLWTLYALQQGVTIVPDANRGNGTIQFINEFFNLRQSDDINESRMYLLSGNTIIEFDGTYNLNNISDKDGNKRMIMAFNKQGSLREKPDKRYVRYTNYFFPGTAIYARIALNSNITQNGNN